MLLAVLERLVAVVGLEEAVHQLEEHLGVTAILDRDEEGNAEEQVRRDGLDVTGVAARALGDLRIVGEVAEAAVDHPAGVSAGAEGEIVALEEGDREAAHRGVARDTDAVHAAADHHHVHVDLGPSLRLDRVGDGRWPGRFHEKDRHDRPYSMPQCGVSRLGSISRVVGLVRNNADVPLDRGDGAPIERAP